LPLFFIIDTMKNITLILLITITSNLSSQSINFTGHLTSPRTDTVYWAADALKILTFASEKTSSCYLCFINNTDSLYEKNCFSSISGHCMLDTNMKVSKKDILGEWKLIEGGIFEIRDSLFNDNEKLIRTITIHDYLQEGTNLLITNNKMRIETIENNKSKIKQKKYSLIKDYHLSIKGFFGQQCSYSNIGVTNEGLLIIDNSMSYSKIIKYDEYFTFITKIQRSIFKKIKQPN